jgi:hypothetical protein
MRLNCKVVHSGVILQEPSSSKPFNLKADRAEADPPGTASALQHPLRS